MAAMKRLGNAYYSILGSSPHLNQLWRQVLARAGVEAIQQGGWLSTEHVVKSDREAVKLFFLQI